MGDDDKRRKILEQHDITVTAGSLHTRYLTALHGLIASLYVTYDLQIQTMIDLLMEADVYGDMGANLSTLVGYKNEDLSRLQMEGAVLMRALRTTIDASMFRVRLYTYLQDLCITWHRYMCAWIVAFTDAMNTLVSTMPVQFAAVYQSVRQAFEMDAAIAIQQFNQEVMTEEYRLSLQRALEIMSDTLDAQDPHCRFLTEDRSPPKTEDAPTTVIEERRRQKRKISTITTS
jgi:hypothetical protein